MKIKLASFLLLLISLGINAEQSEKINLSFDNVELQLVLKSIAKVRGLNLIMSDKVAGKVSIEFSDVSWLKALNLIMQLHSLEFELQDNIIVVAPAGELTKYKLNQQELENKLEQTKPLITRLFPIRFAKAKELVDTLQSSKEAILSKRSQVTADDRTNTLIVKDTEQAISQLIPAIEQLDRKAKQVIIEARMVTVRDNLDEQFGIQWGVTGGANSAGITTSGSLDSLEQVRQGEIEQTDYLSRLNVNLPIPSPAGRVAVQVAKLADGSLLDLELSALERESKGEIIASPRILATNQNTSRIEQGTEIPYLQAAAHGATSVAFKKAVLSLEVTPQITPKDNIILDLVITQDARGDTVITSTGPAVAIDTQQISTRVTAKNGETIVLGGIYQQQVVHSSNKVPVLSDIPYLGRLFKSNTNYNEKRQLLVFVTPKLVLTEE